MTLQVHGGLGPVGRPITLTARDALLYFRVGQRIEFRPPAGRLVRMWRWLVKRNVRVARLDWDHEELRLEWCR